MPPRLIIQLLILVFAICWAAQGTVSAQSGNGAFAARFPTDELTIWGGGSVHTSRIASRLRDATLGMAGVTYARTLLRTRVAALQYTFDVIPAAFLHYPRSDTGTFTTTYGAGFSPLGIRVNFRPHGRLQPFAGLRGGCLYFAGRIPGASGAHFNFTVGLGGGLRIVSRSGRALSFGYMLHHISNADRAPVNPGLDSGIIYAGYSFFR